MTEKIIRNSAKCLECDQELESPHVHAFRTCKCGNLSVDGGLFYLRRLYRDKTKILDTSIVEEE